MTRRGLPVILACTLVVGPAGGQQRATPPPVPASMQACVAAADRAQLARDERRFITARQELLACSEEACPLLVRKDCARWLEELRPRLPGIVVSVRDADNRDLVDVRVLVDGKVVTEKLDGKLFLVDPGEHVFRYEPATAAPIEERVLVREGETNRQLTIKVGRAARSLDVLTPAASEPRAPRSRPIPASSFALGGVGVIGVGGFAFFAESASRNIHEMRDTCGLTQGCAASDVDSAREKLLIANLALGVGVLALAGAVVLYLARGESK